MNKHTAEYLHFPKYSKGMLKSMTKDQLISHIECLYNNWKNSDLRLRFQEELSKDILKYCPNYDVVAFSECHHKITGMNERSVSDE